MLKAATRLWPCLPVLLATIPLIVFNPEFAVSGLEWLMLIGGAVVSACTIAAVGALLWGLLAWSPASGIWWLTCGWLAIVLAAVGWVVSGAMGLLAVVPAGVLASIRLLGQWPSAASPTALTSAALLGTAILSGQILSARAGDSPGRQLVLIGLDGASWDIIDTMRASGRLPTFARLINEGARGELQTLVPVLSPPIWTSIATGKTPEQHGIRDFWGGDGQVRAKRLWEIVDEQGLASAVVGYLVTWPPRKTSGVLVPGWDAQGPETVPPQLGFLKRLEMSEKQGGTLSLGQRMSLVAIGLRYGVTLSTLKAALTGMAARWLAIQSPLDAALEGRLLKLGLTVDVFCHFLRVGKPSLAIYYYSSIDAIEHQFFKYYAPEGFPDLTPESIATYKDAIPRVYEASDDALARIRRWMAPEATMMIVSDHGQRAVEREGPKWYRIHTTKLLKALGVDEGVRSTNVGAGAYLRAGESTADFAEALTAIRSVVTVQDGHPVFALQLGPSGDALLEVDPKATVGEGVMARVGADTVPVTDFLDDSERISGEHTTTAILLMAGPDIARGRSITGGSVLDVTPTALATLGLPVARDMTGGVLEEVFRAGALERQPLRFVDTYGAPAPGLRSEEAIGPDKLERLRALGYAE